jgi:serine/threonine-protein kinase RsbT
LESISTIVISEDFHILQCRKAVRQLAVEIGFSVADQTRVVTATSELARNIIQHAGHGKMTLYRVSNQARKGIKIIFEDDGPGFDPVEALTEGFSTARGLGMGLSGARKLMDEFDLESEAGHGTKVTAVKWL